MEPVSSTIIAYVSLKFIDQFLKDEGYGRIKKWLFPQERYKNQLISVINETIKEHEVLQPFPDNSPQFPFYHSQVVFEELNKYILFKTQYDSHQNMLDKIRGNPNISIPSLEELNNFYGLLVAKINQNEKLKKLFIEENYKSKTFEIFDVLKKIDSKISNVEHRINLLAIDLTFQPNDEWFVKQCRSSIFDLGNRYTPELNFELEISKIFDGLGRTDNFRRIAIKQFDALIIRGKKTLKDHLETKEYISHLEILFNDIYKLFTSLDFSNTLGIPIEDLNVLINGISETSEKLKACYLDEEIKIQNDKKEHRFYHKYGHELNNIREFDFELSKFKKLINGKIFLLANNPILILDGEAGIGKSHMLGDIISKRIASGYESIFLLGQQFITDEDPWTQIFKRLRLDNKSDKFLARINDRARVSGKRIIFFVDAINEGRGKYFWNDNVKSFINEFRNYQWLGLVLTIRTSYKTLIFPQNEIGKLNVIEHTLRGFKNSEYEASKLFFNNYNIELPNVPLLHPEFQNPLFLRLFCEGINKSGLTKIPDGLQGITSIINFFIKNVNEVLSKPQRLDFSNGVDLVSRSIAAILQKKIDNESRYVSYEIASEIIEDTVAKFVTKKGVFLEELISEGIFSKNLFWKSEIDSEEGIYLAYERFEDHLTCKHLLEKYHNVEEEFKANGNLFPYVKDEKAINRNKGLIDAFTIQIPEKTKKEFSEYIPQFKDKYPVVEAFVDSLLWRKVETIDDKSKEYVNAHVFSYRGTADLFWETILSVTSIPQHYFNAMFLHNHLMKFSLAERDAAWTQLLKYKYDNDSSVKRLIDWAWNENDKTHISDDSVRLSSITMAWFHTSTNRQLRDCSTKALVSLLQDRITVLIDLLELFQNINDPYVYERLYAVAYGCAVRTNQIEKLKELSQYIYKQIFDKPEETYPHILLRDYARGVIEYANLKGTELSFDISKARPPYKSNWPDAIYSLDELKEKYDNPDYYHLWSSVMEFGDFARYTIGTNYNFSNWSGFKRNETPIDRDDVYENFKLKLSSAQLELLNNLDPIITEESDEELGFEGNKFKIKIAVGRKSEEDLDSNKKKFKESLNLELAKYYDTEIEPYLDHNNKIINTGKNFDLRVAQRFIFSRAIELGWNPKLHLSFDKEIGTGRGRDTYPHERIGKKYQWIAYYEYLAKLSDNFIKYERWTQGGEQENPYQGPWDPYVRDIDPTMLILDTGNYDEDEVIQYWWTDKNAFNWECTNEDWVKNINDLPDVANLINVQAPNHEEWLVLEGYPEWAEPKKVGEEKWDYAHKRLWVHLRGYFVKDEDYEQFCVWSAKQNFMGRWMPESVDRYEIFSREYYWSPAYRYFTKESADWRDIHDQKSGEFIAKAIVPVERFLWEEELDKSKEKTIRFLKPSDSIYKGMNLRYSRREGEFLNNKSEMVCFATNVHHHSKSFLLVKKEPLLKYLKENNLKIIWTILGEKQIIGGQNFGQGQFRILEFSGEYHFKNGIISGAINTRER